MELDRNGLEVLSRAECLDLLGRVSIGRVGCSTGALPTVLPVNFVVDGESVVIRTAPGSKLDAATRHAVVAFEADDIDPVYHSGWSVLATGQPATSAWPCRTTRIRPRPIDAFPT